MRTLVIGMGEVGTALRMVLQGRYEVDSFDVGGAYQANYAKYDVLHVCFPYRKCCSDYGTQHAGRDFESDVRIYQAIWAPKLVVIHSTVPVGTTRRLGPRTVHSPVQGVHPHLVDGLRTFRKYVGGVDPAVVEFAVDHLQASGIPAYRVSSPEFAEAIKLWLTTGYAWNILLCKEIKRYCDANGLPFEEVYGTVRDYNEGYAKLGRPEVAWPILTPTPGPLGGHCLRPNSALLDARVAQIVRDWSDGYADELPAGGE